MRGVSRVASCREHASPTNAVKCKGTVKKKSTHIFTLIYIYIYVNIYIYIYIFRYVCLYPQINVLIYMQGVS